MERETDAKKKNCVEAQKYISFFKNNMLDSLGPKDENHAKKISKRHEKSTEHMVYISRTIT